MANFPTSLIDFSLCASTAPSFALLPTGGGRLFDCLPKSLLGWSGARIHDMVQSMVCPVIRGEGSLFAYSKTTAEMWLRTSATLQVARFQN